jgi:hypothetical protein
VETAQTEAANSIRPSTEPPAIGDTETVTLTCVDEKGQPVSGAEVYIVQIILHPMAGVGLTMEDDAEMRVTGPFGSGVDGRLPPLNFDTGRQSSYQAYARIAGELVGAWGLFRHNYPRGAQWDEIVLTPSTTVQGHVEVPKGFDVRNVTVRLLTTYVRDGKRGTIGSGFANAGKSREPIVPPLADRHPDPQGNFRFTDLPRNGNVYFAATAAGLGEAQHYQFEQVPGQTFSIEMELESTIFGSVRYENTNAPAAGVHVFARPRPGRDSKLGVTSHFVSKTDSLGRYQFNGLAEAAYDVFVYAAGNPIEWVAPVTSNIAVGVRESRGPVDLYYERGGWVEGTVRETHSGDPIADAMVCALNPADVGDGQALSVMTTQADGAFRMLLPTGDSLLYFMAVPNGFAYPKEQGRKTVTIERNQREALHVEFELEASEPYVDPGRAVVTGRVIDAVGLPIEGVPIHDDYEYTQGDKRMEHHFLGATGDDGRFRFHVSARGSHQIEIGGGRYAPRGYSDVLFNVVEKERFTAKTDETYELGDTVVERYTEVIGGTITDESGLAVANIDLWLRSDAWEGVRGATTDETGAFAFRYVPRGRFQLIVEPDEFERTVLDAESGFDYKITLKRADDPGPSPRN